MYSLQAVLNMPWPHFWSVLFFLMMFTLGMGSQFGGIEAICTSLIDQWPHLRQHHWRVTAGVCLCCFLAGLPMICNGGVYMFTLMEWHTASWAILLLGLAEVSTLLLGMTYNYFCSKIDSRRIEYVFSLYFIFYWITKE